jgi:hypothetical protein
MALNPQLSLEAVNAQANALAPLLNSGYIRIYEGAQPDSADDAITDQVLLAELRFAATAFPAAVAGVLTANAIVADAAANATGEAEFARLLKSNGSSPIADGTVGTSDANILLSTTSITVGTAVSIAALVITVPQSGETLEEGV